MGYAIIGRRWRWPGGVIPYRINEDDFPPPRPSRPESGERLAILNAIADYNRDMAGVLTIRPAEAGDLGGKIIDFVAGDGSTACSSPVGRQPGGLLNPLQKVRCDPAGRRGTLKHELGHAIGLFHEHQRVDRQQFVNVLMDNVIDDKRHNFEMRSSEGQEIGAYDLGSIMHYFDDAFAINWSYGQRVHGGQRSRATPALAALNGEIHMVHVGSGGDLATSQNLWHARWTAADGWSDDEPVSLGQKSSTTPALAVLNNELHMVHLGSTGSRTLWHSRWIPPNLGDWEPNKTIALRETSTAPALTGFHDQLHMVALGTSGSRTLWHSVWDPPDLGDWVDDKPIGGRQSSTTPALAVFDNELHMVALGSPGSNTLWHSRWNSPRLGDWTEDESIHSGARRTAPALCTSGAIMHLAYLGSDSNVLWHSDFNGRSWSPRQRDDNNHPMMGPALADVGGTLLSVFVGSSNRIWSSTRDRTRRLTVDPHPGLSISRTGALSPGDIATITAMYS